MRWPVDKPRVTPHGGYLFHRTSGKFCDAKPPCDHHGIDLAGDENTVVYAPETGTLVYSFVGDRVKPFSRFGPAGVVIKGTTSGLYHLLMHLEAPTAFRAMQSGGKATKSPAPFVVLEGSPIGRVSASRKHVHWEVRTNPRDRSTHVDPESLAPELAEPTGQQPPTSRSSGAGWLLLILLGLAVAR